MPQVTRRGIPSWIRVELVAFPEGQRSDREKRCDNHDETRVMAGQAKTTPAAATSAKTPTTLPLASRASKADFVAMANSGSSSTAKMGQVKQAYIAVYPLSSPSHSQSPCSSRSLADESSKGFSATMAVVDTGTERADEAERGTGSSKNEAEVERSGTVGNLINQESERPPDKDSGRRGDFEESLSVRHALWEFHPVEESVDVSLTLRRYPPGVVGLSSGGPVAWSGQIVG